MEDKSFVGMTQCFYCGKDKDIAMDRRLRDRLPKHVGIVDMEPCNDCKGYMEQGIMLIAVKDDAECAKVEAERQEWLKGPQNTPFIPNPYRTGHTCVVKDDAILGVVTDDTVKERIRKMRWTFIPMDAWDMLGLPKKGT